MGTDKINKALEKSKLPKSDCTSMLLEKKYDPRSIQFSNSISYAKIV